MTEFGREMKNGGYKLQSIYLLQITKLKQKKWGNMDGQKSPEITVCAGDFKEPTSNSRKSIYRSLSPSPAYNIGPFKSTIWGPKGLFLRNREKAQVTSPKRIWLFFLLFFSVWRKVTV